MEQTLADIRNKLANNVYKNEEHVRLSLVGRVIQELGWDLWNPSEVNSEFHVIPTEKQARVDLALFLNPRVPSVFLEIKAAGKLEGNIGPIERQLRDYNLNNTAMFSVITDGRKWRFYYSQTGGEFSQKCFKTLDIIKDDISKLKESFRAFLSKGEIRNGNAKRRAEKDLQWSQKRLVVENALPKAQRLVMKPPFPTLPKALVQILAQDQQQISEAEAVRIIQGADLQRFPPEKKAEPYFQKITPSKWKKIRNHIIDRSDLWRAIIEQKQITSDEAKKISPFESKTMGAFTKFVTHSGIATRSGNVFIIDEEMIPDIQKLLSGEFPEYNDPEALGYLTSSDPHRRKKIKQNILDRRELWEVFVNNRRMTVAEFKRLSYFKPKAVAGFMHFLTVSKIALMFGETFILDEAVIPEIEKLLKGN